ncbi:MAG: hypothetical protein ACK4YT_13700, partial [Sphingomonas sp.]
MQGNMVGVEGLSALALALRRNKALQTLLLADNRIGGVRFVRYLSCTLCAATSRRRNWRMPQHAPLEEDVRCMERLRDTLLVNTTLTALDLSLNNLDEHAARTLLPALAPVRWQSAD